MPIIDTKELISEFPENSIVLLNGKELSCYPKAEATAENVDDNLELDTTGRYLVIGNRCKAKATEEEQESKTTLFTDNAFLFYRNIHRIFSDSRMFLAPVPIQNGMAYTGTSGFHTPTLGVYLEWWLNCEVDMTKDGKGKDALTFHIAGSPLSGANHCSCVYPDGTIKGISHYPFRSVWSMFMKINKRYAEAKAKYEAYSLEEVVEILKGYNNGRESELASRLLAEEAHTNVAVRLLNQLKKTYKELQDKYHDLLVLYHKKELDDFRTGYLSRIESIRIEQESVKEQKAIFRKQVKQGLITNAEYQHLITPLSKKIKEMETQLSLFKMERINYFLKLGNISYANILNYINRVDDL